MASVDEFLKKMPPWQRGLLVLGLMVAIGAGYFFGLYKGMLDDYNNEKKLLEKNKVEYNKLEKDLENIDVLKKETEKLTRELEKLEKKIPSEQELNKIIYDLADISEQGGVKITRIDKSSETKDKKAKEMYYEIIYPITLEGRYHSFVGFLDRLTSKEQDRIMSVKNIKMVTKSKDKGSENLNINFNVVTYKFYP